MTFISGYSLSFDYADLPGRIGAFIVDILLIVLFSSMVNRFFPSGAEVGGASPFGLAFQIMVPWFYFAVMESSPRQATLGKIALGIKVTDINGRPALFGRAALRAMIKTIPIFWIGFFLAGFNPRRQALHDIIARTLVLRGAE